MTTRYVDDAKELLNTMSILKENIFRSIEHSNNDVTNGRLEYAEIKMLKDDISNVILAAGKLERSIDNKLIDNFQSDIATLNNKISLHDSAHDIFGGC